MTTSLMALGLKVHCEDYSSDHDEKKELLEFGASHGLLGEAPCFLSFLKELKRFSELPEIVLLEGETGTGKELAAIALHNKKQEPFIPINCADLDGDMARIEISGYKGGAFTGSDKKDRDGIFVQAKGGTIFLDEVELLNPQTQGLLLRVLEQRKIRPVAGGEEIDVSDVRIVAACNEDLCRLSHTGKFRKDLYYRLCVLPIRIPPLRNRVDDIGHLARHFISKYAKRMNSATLTISEEAIEYLQCHDWLGNVRELEHTIIRVLAKKADGTPIEMDDLMPSPEQASTSSFLHPDAESRPSTLAEARKTAEKIAILHALDASCHNRKNAAAILDVVPQTLVNKMREYGLS